jgi:hypothetical protein
VFEFSADTMHCRAGQPDACGPGSGATTHELAMGPASRTDVMVEVQGGVANERINLTTTTLIAQSY